MRKIIGLTLAAIIIFSIFILVKRDVQIEKKNHDISINRNNVENIKSKDKRIGQKEKLANAQQKNLTKSVAHNEDEDEINFKTPQQLRNKIFLSKEDLELRDEFYSSPEIIRNAYLSLMNTQNIVIGKAYLKHIEALNYLKKGLAIESNKSRPEIAQKLKYYLIKDFDDQIKDLNQRKLVFGDKLEIIKSLNEYAPEIIQEIQENYSAKHLSKLFAYLERRK